MKLVQVKVEKDAKLAKYISLIRKFDPTLSYDEARWANEARSKRVQLEPTRSKIKITPSRMPGRGDFFVQCSPWKPTL
jgi:hypothetical protein